MAVTVSFLEIAPTVSLANNPVSFIVASSVTGKTNLSIHLEILEYNGSAWVGTGLEDVLTTIDGEAIFDISAYFEALLEPKFTYPEHFTNIVIPQSTMSVKYRVKAWESYTDTDGTAVSKEADDSLTYDADFYVIPGAVSEDDQATLNTLSTTWWEEWVALQKFQLWLPGTKKTSVKAVEKLYWVARRTATETVTIAWTGTDATTGTITKTAAMTAYNMYELCISPAIVEALAVKEIASYTVTITGQSETITYTIDRDYYEKEEFFFFTNNFNCYESLWCRGLREGELSFNRVEYEQPLPANYSHTSRRLGNTRAITTRSRRSNTGYLESETWYNWALALLSGNDAWAYGSDSMVPVVVTGEKATYINDLNDLWNLEIEWKHSREGRFGGSMGLMLQYLLPPYLDKVAAYFFRIARPSATITSEVSATTSGNSITFPEITGSDVMDFSDATFWDNSQLNWYDAGAPRTCPLQFLQGWVWAEAATAATLARLFHRDYINRTKDILPIIIYNQNMTEAEQLVIVDWLNWYFVLTQNGAILTQGGDMVVQ